MQVKKNKNSLVHDSDKYLGKYVTVKSFASKKVITYGKNPVDVVRRAEKLGYKEPVLIFVFKTPFITRLI